MFELADPLADVFEREGYVVLRSVLDAAEVARVRGWFARLPVMGAAPSRQILYTHQAPQATRPAMETLMDQWLYPASRTDSELGMTLLSRLRTSMARLLGFPPIPFQDVALCKAPRHGAFAWHQDAPYWPVDREDGAVSWVALQRVNRENGGLELAPGSHRGPRGPAIDLHTGAPQEGSPGTPDIPEHGSVPDLSAGDAIVFHERCWHRSGRNLTGCPRLAWSISWLHPGARWNLSRAPRHPVGSCVVDGEEVVRWSSARYPRLPG